ncbi:hypothetical protein [Symbiopectobacterium sp.]|uniref:hypothetical protein n=1 Tax=Symbiopectobacterium sp. TaxID=2952789 RepID=UPI003F376774
MSKQITEQLLFRPASEKPVVGMDGKDVLIYNPCDGYHIGHVRAFEEDGALYNIGIYSWAMDEYTPHDFYVAWALLPDNQNLREQFSDQKGLAV